MKQSKQISYSCYTLMSSPYLFLNTSMNSWVLVFDGAFISISTLIYCCFFLLQFVFIHLFSNLTWMFQSWVKILTNNLWGWFEPVAAPSQWIYSNTQKPVAGIWQSQQTCDRQPTWHTQPSISGSPYRFILAANLRPLQMNSFAYI